MTSSIYLSGPITGRLNARKEFASAAKALSVAGWPVVNPFDVVACTDRSCGGRWKIRFAPTSDGQISFEEGRVFYYTDRWGPREVTMAEVADWEHTWECYLKHDLIAMLGCTDICVLPGWELSKGARLEFQTALAVGMRFHMYDPDTKDFL